MRVRICPEVILATIKKHYQKEEIKSLIKKKDILKSHVFDYVNNIYSNVNAINQALRLKKSSVTLKAVNRYTLQLIQILQNLKLIYNYQRGEARLGYSDVYDITSTSVITIYFKMKVDQTPFFKSIKFLSYPSQRQYTSLYQINRVSKITHNTALPVILLTTSKYGIITHLEAKKLQVGGQLLAKINITT